MPDLKTSELPDAEPFANGDIFPVVQSGQTRKATTRKLMQSHPRFLATRYFDIAQGRQSIAGVTLVPAADTLYLFPFIGANADVPWLSIAMRITVAAGSGGAMKAGVWEVEPSVLQPRGLPLAVSNDGVTLTSTGMRPAPLAAAWTPTVGKMYAAGYVCNSASPLATPLSFANTNMLFCFLAGVEPGASGGSTPQCWKIAKPHADDLSTFNITGGLTTELGAQPMLFAGT